MFDILHGNLREIIAILHSKRTNLDLWMTTSMLMTAACFFYATFAEIETNFEKLLWLGAVICFSAITIFIFGIFLGLTWAKRILNDLKDGE